MFMYLLDQTVWNLLDIYTKPRCSKSHLEFRLSLVEQIIEKYKIAKDQPEYSSSKSSSLHLVGRYFTEIIPSIETKKDQHDSVKCAV